jgi:hypothetical protein
MKISLYFKIQTNFFSPLKLLRFLSESSVISAMPETSKKKHRREQGEIAESAEYFENIKDCFSLPSACLAMKYNRKL